MRCGMICENYREGGEECAGLCDRADAVYDRAKKEFEETGTLDASTYMELTSAGFDAQYCINNWEANEEEDDYDTSAGLGNFDSDGDYDTGLGL